MFLSGTRVRAEVYFCMLLPPACLHPSWNMGCGISLQKSTNYVLEIGLSRVLFKGTYCANTCMSSGSV